MTSQPRIAGRTVAASAPSARPIAVGLDFGTASARALLLDLQTGRSVTAHRVRYRSGVLTERTPDGDALPPRWAIQDPADFMHASAGLLQWASCQAGRRSLRIESIGVSCTSCTVMPALRDGTPLLHTAAFRGRRHAYAKLWKHHAAEPHARRITDARPEFLLRYGGQTSAEWSLAKAWQTMAEDPALWHATQRWIDVGDWIVWLLTGRETRSASQAGCKNHWQPHHGGYPAATALESIGTGLSSWLDKLTDPHPLGTIAGPLTPSWQERTGIPGTARVGVAIVDAQAAVPGSDVDTPGVLVAAVGTSTCHMSLSEHAVAVPGVESTVDGGAIPGLFDHSTGQPATGDMFDWFAGLLSQPGGASRVDVFGALTEQLATAPGPSPVTVMDWWNGCRTPLGRPDLGGVIEGLTTDTTPVDIYRGMLEASAMGMRYAVGLHNRVRAIDEIRLTGGMAGVPAIMQLYADVLGRPLRANPISLGSARGAAISAATGGGWRVPASVGYREYQPRDPARYRTAYQRYVSRIGAERRCERPLRSGAAAGAGDDGPGGGLVGDQDVLQSGIQQRGDRVGL